MDNWFIKKKSLNDKDNNENMTSYEKKGSVKKLLFDSVPIENYIVALLHVEIGVGNKIVYTSFDWIYERIEPITDDELELTNDWIDLKIDSKNHVKDYDEWIKNYSSLLAKFRLERQGIICLMEERDGMNKHIVKGKERKKCLIIKTFLQQKLTN